VTRTDLQKLANLRIEEAEALLKARKYSGAYYLAGYAVECALKACIAKKTKRHDWPNKDLVSKCFTHDIERLLDLAGLKPLLPSDPAFQINWGIVKDWSEQDRYEQKSRAEALALYNAITDPTHGVLPWIKTHW
jgi:HEPN domain-containing protein